MRNFKMMSHANSILIIHSHYAVNIQFDRSEVSVHNFEVKAATREGRKEKQCIAKIFLILEIFCVIFSPAERREKIFGNFQTVFLSRF